MKEEERTVEVVIKGLEACLSGELNGPDPCSNCPYDGASVFCRAYMFHDAIKYLKKLVEDDREDDGEDEGNEGS